MINLNYLGHTFELVKTLNPSDNVKAYLCNKCNCYCYMFDGPGFTERILYDAHLLKHGSMIFLSQTKLELTCDKAIIKSIIE